MTEYSSRITKIRKFAEERDSKEREKRMKHDEDVSNYIERIKEKLEKVQHLCMIAAECKKNRIDIGEKQDILKSQGIKTNCFISNGISHCFGFNKDLTGLGFYNGGACGNVDMFLFTNGTIIKPDSNIELSNLKKWIDNFDEFEKAFLEYIDNL